MSLPAVCIGALDLVLLLKFKRSVPVVIGISALLGLLCFGVLGWQLARPAWYNGGTRAA